MKVYYGSDLSVGGIAVGEEVVFSTMVSAISAGIGAVIGTVVGRPIIGATYGAGIATGVASVALAHDLEVSLVLPLFLTSGSAVGTCVATDIGAMYADYLLSLPPSFIGHLVSQIGQQAAWQSLQKGLVIAGSAVTGSVAGAFIIGIGGVLFLEDAIDYFADNKVAEQITTQPSENLNTNMNCIGQSLEECHDVT